VHDDDKQTMLPIAKRLDEMGFQIAATRGTAEYLFRNGVFAEVVLKVHEGRPNLVDHLRAGRLSLVINTPLGRYTQRDDDYIRIETVRAKVPYTTTTSAAEAAAEGIAYQLRREVTPRALPDRTFAS
jgi:carbamoyl-phosphate synthase large subunit